MTRGLLALADQLGDDVAHAAVAVGEDRGVVVVAGAGVAHHEVEVADEVGGAQVASAGRDQRLLHVQGDGEVGLEAVEPEVGLRQVDGACGCASPPPPGLRPRRCWAGRRRFPGWVYDPCRYSSFAARWTGLLLASAGAKEPRNLGDGEESRRGRAIRRGTSKQIGRRNRHTSCRAAFRPAFLVSPGLQAWDKAGRLSPLQGFSPLEAAQESRAKARSEGLKPPPAVATGA